LVGVAGAAPIACAVINTRFDWQVSADNTIWSTSLVAAPGEHVFVRGALTYTGGGSPVGLANWIFQPTVSNWDVGPGDPDHLLPFVNGGMGGNSSTPVGVVTNPSDPTQFGRLSPWGRVALGSSTYLRGHVHLTTPNGDGLRYLRIAQAQTTSWWGEVGNTNGAGGVPIAQLSNVGRTSSDPPFNPSTQGVVVFKFGVLLSQNTVDRELVVSRAVNYGWDPPIDPTPQVRWFASLDEGSGSILGEVEFHDATINVVVPAPGTVVAMGVAGLAWRRRRGAGGQRCAR
jgi:hypothetical protein